MAKEAKQKISETAVGAPAPVVVYAGSAEEALIAPHRRITVASNIVGSNYLPSSSLYTDEIGQEEVWQADSTGDGEGDGDGATSNPDDEPSKKTPTFMDIVVVSNKIVYDAAGNPSATIVFKIKNSNKLPVKAVNSRVKVI